MTKLVINIEGSYKQNNISYASNSNQQFLTNFSQLIFEITKLPLENKALLVFKFHVKYAASRLSQLSHNFAQNYCFLQKSYRGYSSTRSSVLALDFFWNIVSCGGFLGMLLFLVLLFAFHVWGFCSGVCTRC